MLCTSTHLQLPIWGFRLLAEDNMQSISKPKAGDLLIPVQAWGDSLEWGGFFLVLYCLSLPRDAGSEGFLLHPTFS